MLLIDRMRFEIDAHESSFGAVINHGRAWWFIDLAYHGDEPRPVISIEGMPLPVRSWKELAGRQFDLGSLEDENFGATLYVGEHTPVFGTKIRFGARVDCQYRVQLECMTEDGIFDPVEPSVVRADDKISFEGVLVRSQERPPANEREALAHLAEQLDPAGFVFDRMQGDDFWFRAVV